MDAVAELDYKPNEIARSLSRGRTGTIGLLIHDIRNPNYADAGWYADRIFGRHEYSSIMANGDKDPGREGMYVNDMLYREVEGILCIGYQKNDAKDVVELAAVREVPVVLVDCHDAPQGIDAVTLDDVYGGQLAVDYLLALGHGRIGFLTSDSSVAEQKRKEGYLSALRSRGIDADPSLLIVQDEDLWQRGDNPELLELLRRPDRPTALVASNDTKAIRTLRLLHRFGANVPGEISLVGFDDIDSASIVIPALTTVHQPIDKMIDLGAQILLRRIKGHHGEPSHTTLRPWLVERESARKLL